MEWAQEKSIITVSECEICIYTKQEKHSGYINKCEDLNIHENARNMQYALLCSTFYRINMHKYEIQNYANYVCNQNYNPFHKSIENVVYKSGRPHQFGLV